MKNQLSSVITLCLNPDTKVEDETVNMVKKKKGRLATSKAEKLRRE